MFLSLLSRFKKLLNLACGLFIVFSVTEVHAEKIFDITTGNLSVIVAPQATAMITYTVQNTSGMDMSHIDYIAPMFTTNTQTGSCGNSLADGASCTVVLQLTAPQTQTSFTLSPLKICAKNKAVCSKPETSNLPRITVASISSILVTPQNVTINAHARQQFAATATYSNGRTSDVTSSVAWHSSDSTVATISASGLALGLFHGGATSITATLGSVTSPAASLNTPILFRGYVLNSQDGTVSVVNTANDQVVTDITVADNPQFAVISPSKTRLYVANTDSNSVSVINTSNNQVVTTVPVGTEPKAMAITPDGSKVFVVNTSGDSVSVISTASNTVTATIPVGTSPQWIDIMPDGSKAYVANAAGSVSVISVSINTVIATIPLPGLVPQQLAVTPDGAKVFTANQVGSSSVINTATDSVVATIALASDTTASYISMLPDGTKAYITDTANNRISAIQVATNSLLQTINVGILPGPVATIITSTKCYVPNQNGNTVSAITTASNSVTATVPGLDNPWFAAANSSGSKLYVANHIALGTVSVISTINDTVTGTINVGALPSFIVMGD